MTNSRVVLQVLVFLALVLSLVVPALAAASRAAPRPDGRSISHPAAHSSSATPTAAMNTPEAKANPGVAAGQGHTVGLKYDGTVVALGSNTYGQCNLFDWNLGEAAPQHSFTVATSTAGSQIANEYNRLTAGGIYYIRHLAKQDCYSIQRYASIS